MLRDKVLKKYKKDKVLKIYKKLGSMANNQISLLALLFFYILTQYSYKYVLFFI